MERAHQQALRTNRIYLIAQLHAEDIRGILDFLIHKNIVTDYLYQKVLSNHIVRDQTVCLMDALPKKGPHAFTHFLSALDDVGKGYAAQKLSPGFQPKKTSQFRVDSAQFAKYNNDDEEFSDTEFPEQNESPTIAVEVRPVKKKELIRIFHDGGSNSVYSMSSPTRGIALIINNVQFINQEDGSEDLARYRAGSNQDFMNIDRLFQELQFDRKVFTDLKAQKMKEIIQKVVTHKNQSNYKAFVLVIMSHGRPGLVEGVDGQPLRFSEIKESLNGANAPLLAGKPKLVLIQACQGTNVDKGVEPAGDGSEDTGDASEDTGDASKGPGAGDGSGYAQSDPHPRARHAQADSGGATVGTNRDVIFAQAACDGFVAWRDQEIGSWFIRAVVKVFMKHACHADVSTLLRAVGNKVDKATTELSKAKQTPECTSTLVKTFHLFPGLPEQT